MISILAFVLLAILGLSAMGCVYYLCEIDTSFEEDNRRKISVTSNGVFNSNGNDVA